MVTIGERRARIEAAGFKVTPTFGIAQQRAAEAPIARGGRVPSAPRETEVQRSQRLRQEAFRAETIEDLSAEAPIFTTASPGVIRRIETVTKGRVTVRGGRGVVLQPQQLSLAQLQEAKVALAREKAIIRSEQARTAAITEKQTREVAAERLTTERAAGERLFTPLPTPAPRRFPSILAVQAAEEPRVPTRVEQKRRFFTVLRSDLAEAQTRRPPLRIRLLPSAPLKAEIELSRKREAMFRATLAEPRRDGLRETFVRGVTRAAIVREKGLQLVGGARLAVREEVRERPLRTLATVGVGVLTGGVAAVAVRAAPFAAPAVTAIGRVGAGLYAAVTGKRIAEAPTPEAKGVVIGRAGLEAGAFVGGAVVGARAVSPAAGLRKKFVTRPGARVEVGLEKAELTTRVTAEGKQFQLAALKFKFRRGKQEFGATGRAVAEVIPVTPKIFTEKGKFAIEFERVGRAAPIRVTGRQEAIGLVEEPRIVTRGITKTLTEVGKKRFRTKGEFVGVEEEVGRVAGLPVTRGFTLLREGRRPRQFVVGTTKQIAEFPALAGTIKKFRTQQVGISGRTLEQYERGLKFEIEKPRRARVPRPPERAAVPITPKVIPRVTPRAAPAARQITQIAEVKAKVITETPSRLVRTATAAARQAAQKAFPVRRVRVTTRTRARVSPAVAGVVGFRAIQAPRVAAAVIPAERLAERVTPITRARVTPITKVTPITRPALITRPITTVVPRLGVPPFAPLVPVTPFPGARVPLVPPIVPVGIPRGALAGRAVRFVTPSRQPKRFTPTAFAAAFRIEAPRREAARLTRTGLSLRAITPEPKKRRKRKKKKEQRGLLFR